MAWCMHRCGGGSLWFDVCMYVWGLICLSGLMYAWMNKAWWISLVWCMLEWMKLVVLSGLMNSCMYEAWWVSLVWCMHEWMKPDGSFWLMYMYAWMYGAWWISPLWNMHECMKLDGSLWYEVSMNVCSLIYLFGIIHAQVYEAWYMYLSGMMYAWMNET